MLALVAGVAGVVCKRTRTYTTLENNARLFPVGTAAGNLYQAFIANLKGELRNAPRATFVTFVRSLSQQQDVRTIVAQCVASSSPKDAALSRCCDNTVFSHDEGCPSCCVCAVCNDIVHAYLKENLASEDLSALLHAAKERAPKVMRVAASAFGEDASGGGGSSEKVEADYDCGGSGCPPMDDASSAHSSHMDDASSSCTSHIDSSDALSISSTDSSETPGLPESDLGAYKIQLSFNGNPYTFRLPGDPDTKYVVVNDACNDGLQIALSSGLCIVSKKQLSSSEGGGGGGGGGGGERSVYFCSLCDSFNVPANTVDCSRECIHKSAAMDYFDTDPQELDLPSFNTPLFEFKSARTSGTVICLPDSPRHVNYCVVPTHCVEAYMMQPAVARVPKFLKGRVNAKCKSCSVGSSNCIHCAILLNTLSAIIDPKEVSTNAPAGGRGSSVLRRPQTTAVYDASAQLYITRRSLNLVELPDNLTPKNGGGTFSTCPVCDGRFATAPVKQCPLFVIHSIDGTMHAAQRDMCYFKCANEDCSGRNYYDGNKHNIVVLTAMPELRGRPQERAWGISVSFLFSLLKDTLTRSLYACYSSNFTKLAYPTRTDFTAAINRARLYIIKVPSLSHLPPIVVLDGNVSSSPMQPTSFVTPTAASSAIHICAPCPPGNFVNPSCPIIGGLGDTLSYLPPGLPQLYKDLSLDEVRNMLLRLGLSAAYRRRDNIAPDTMGWGVLGPTNSSKQDMKFPVLAGELADLTFSILTWSVSVLQCKPLNTPTRTSTAYKLATSLGSLTPLLSMLCSGTASDAKVLVPGCMGSLLFTLQSRAACSAVARLPHLGAVYFPLLFCKLRDSGLSGLSDIVRCAKVQSGLTPHLGGATNLTFSTVLRFLSPELYDAITGDLQSLGIAPFLSIINHYATLSKTASDDDVYLLLNEVVTPIHYVHTFGASLTSPYDVLFAHMLPLRLALLHNNAAVKGEAEAVRAALAFPPAVEPGEMANSFSYNFQRCIIHNPDSSLCKNLHYYNTHDKRELTHCTNCCRQCDSAHCLKAAKQGDSDDNWGCSHRFEGRAGYTGGSIVVMDPIANKVVAGMLLQFKESLRDYFIFFNNFNSIMPRLLLFDAACQLFSYFYRRNPARIRNSLFVIDDLHSKDHRVCACCAHFHKPCYHYQFPAPPTGPTFNMQLLYASACEGFWSWLGKRYYPLTATVPTCYMQMYFLFHYYNTIMQREGGGGEAREELGRPRPLRGFPKPHEAFADGPIPTVVQINDVAPVPFEASAVSYKAPLLLKDRPMGQQEYPKLQRKKASRPDFGEEAGALAAKERIPVQFAKFYLLETLKRAEGYGKPDFLSSMQHSSFAALVNAILVSSFPRGGGGGSGGGSGSGVVAATATAAYSPLPPWVCNPTSAATIFCGKPPAPLPGTRSGKDNSMYSTDFSLLAPAPHALSPRIFFKSRLICIHFPGLATENTFICYGLLKGEEGKEEMSAEVKHLEVFWSSKDHADAAGAAHSVNSRINWICNLDDAEAAAFSTYLIHAAAVLHAPPPIFLPDSVIASWARHFYFGLLSSCEPRE